MRNVTEHLQGFPSALPLNSLHSSASAMTFNGLQNTSATVQDQEEMQGKATRSRMLSNGINELITGIICGSNLTYQPNSDSVHRPGV